MGQVTDEKIAAVVTDIVSEVNPELVYLFGSRARGDATADSDVDLMVIAGEAFGRNYVRYEQLAKLTRLAVKHRIPADIVLYSREEFARMRDWPGHVASDAAREGRLLYAKS